ncbi:MAG TPA: AbrB/MazE/SpoVT family DNA-binding domain-containing protein [Myxococcaceae bacterium]
MSTAATTKMSSRGQVVIPEAVRDKLGLGVGTRFVVTGEGDVVVLKKLNPPSMAEFDEIIATARRQARAAGLTKGQVRTAVRKVRRRR